MFLLGLLLLFDVFTHRMASIIFFTVDNRINEITIYKYV